ncbi:MAG: outer membrane protein assembly factor BamE [Halorhodospira sp.]
MLMPQKRNLFLLQIFSAALLAGGCGGHFPFAQPLEIEQGNLLEKEDIARVQPGMSKAAVERLLGRPLLEHPFEAQRWDYLYERRGTEQAQRRLTLHFEDGEVVEIEDRWNGDDA